MRLQVIRSQPIFEFMPYRPALDGGGPKICFNFEETRAEACVRDSHLAILAAEEWQMEADWSS